MVAAIKGDPAAPGDTRTVPDAPEQDGGARETARRTKTRERLMDSAYRLFSEHGINGTSIEAIADDAGFTRGAFYSNFGSKIELFFALTERENQTRLDTLRDHFARIVKSLECVDGEPGEDLIEEVIADILRSQTGTRQWCLMLSEFRLLAMRDPAVAPRFLDNTRVFQRQLADILETAARSVGLRFVIDPVHMTQLLTDQYEAAMQEAILAGAEDSELTTRETVMHTLPALVRNLTELTGSERTER
ncbi:TetR/AcrR family transcriptional regulator [Parasphingorhabdus pacifica]